MATSVRVTVGFKGGQVLAVRLTQEALNDLLEALGDGGWHGLDTEEGPVRLDLGNVVYVGSESQEPRVGFG